MNSAKTSVEDQMGSGESDDEFYNVGNLNKIGCAEKDSSRKVNSPKRTKIKYDYKFDSSSDSDSDDTSSKKCLKSVKSSDLNKTGGDSGKMRETKFPAQASKVDEKINEQRKCVTSENDKVTKDGLAATSSKAMPPPSPCVPSPVVVVPQPIIVSQTHSVMAMAPTGMIVPPAIGLANQNVMIPPPNILNLPGNVIRAPNAVGGIMATAPGGAVMGMGNPSMLSQIQNQGSVMGMTNDILQLQGNIMGYAPGSMMAMPGICMAGNMIPVQGALQSNFMRIPGPNAAVTNQAGIMGSAGTMMSPGGVMINAGSVMAVTNVVGNQGHMMGNAENLMLSMNNFGARMNYPGNVLDAQGMNTVGNAKGTEVPNEVPRTQDSQTQICTREWRIRSKPRSKMKSLKKKKKMVKKSLVKRVTAKEDRSAQEDEEEEEDEDEDEDDEGGQEEEGQEEGGQEEQDEEDEYEEEEEDAEEEDKKPVIKETTNTFKNDGSFMEMFKKMSEANSKASSNKNEKSSAERNESEASSLKRPTVLISGIVGKRRGGRVLKTGLVKKVKKDSENEEEKGPKDAWAVYMAEVKKYREASCEEEGKTRPLVK